MNIQVFPPKLTPTKMPPIYIYIALERQTFMMEGGVSITLCAKTSCAKPAAPKRHVPVQKIVSNFRKKPNNQLCSQRRRHYKKVLHMPILCNLPPFSIQQAFFYKPKSECFLGKKSLVGSGSRV
ncbi:hypothetical protein RF11_12929 [Thelohanellus kitauei]|uniref:Uncharacterized protein n=1 Tax=Thelohanellus kitauei TaxID=669202 RepID=A0A0C2MQ37_THEKT|nr:hypothetical protein RF11_12929 [Thelohanellus kitauei]